VNSFVFNGQAQRVVFGAGSLAQLAQEIELLGTHRALVLSTPEQRDEAQAIVQLLGVRAAGIFDRAVMHVPIEVAREARQVAERLNADCAVTFGGGSTTGLGKAIALVSGLPIIAIPTTYAGSEMTPIFGITEGGLKKTGKDFRVLPRTVIYDPQLTFGLPPRMSVTSGINAIAHAAEGLYSTDSNPIMDLMAVEGIAALGAALPLIAAADAVPPSALGQSATRQLPSDEIRDARAKALYGAWLCGAVLGNVGMALHHKLCHTLGGTFNLPHAETHTIVLPHALAYNANAAPAAMAKIAGALRAPSAPRAVFELARCNGAAVALRDIGMKQADLDRACDLALRNQYPNPQPLDRVAIRALLQNAFDGTAP
jgi:maleylacetate reductase